MKSPIGFVWVAGVLSVANSFAPSPTRTAVRSGANGILNGMRSPRPNNDNCGLQRRGKNMRATNIPDDNVEHLMQRRRFVVAACITALPLASATLLPADCVAKDLKEEYRQGTAALAEMDDQAPVPRDAYKKLDSGVIYADVRPGSSSSEGTVGPGSRVNRQWVLRKSNGYFVDRFYRSKTIERHEEHPLEVHEVSKNKRVFKQ